MGKVTSALLATALVLPAAAQNLSSLGSTGGTAPPATETAPALQDPNAPKPSRFVLQDVDAYLETMKVRLAIHGRETGPFGRPQDPTAKPPQPVVTPAMAAAQNTPDTPFEDVVRSIRVTAVIPGQKQFLVGSRTISEGDVFPVVVHDRSIRVRIAEVNAREILFQNMEDGTTVPLRAQMLPAGMSRGGDGLEVPGLQRNSSSAPLQIDLSPPERGNSSR